MGLDGSDVVTEETTRLEGRPNRLRLREPRRTQTHTYAGLKWDALESLKAPEPTPAVVEVPEAPGSR
jgi:hypothetical protein